MLRLVRYFLLLIIFFINDIALANNNYEAINYTITPVFNAPTPYIKINVQIAGEFSGKIVINFPDKWANTDYSHQVKNIKLNNPHETITVKKIVRLLHLYILDILI